MSHHLIFLWNNILNNESLCLWYLQFKFFLHFHDLARIPFFFCFFVLFYCILYILLLDISEGKMKDLQWHNNVINYCLTIKCKSLKVWLICHQKFTKKMWKNNWKKKNYQAILDSEKKLKGVENDNWLLNHSCQNEICRQHITKN